jgi:ribosome-binding ATPase
LKSRQKQARVDKSVAEEIEALEKANAALAEGTPLYRADLKDDEREALAPLFFLTNKPVMMVVNVAEDDIGNIDAKVKPVIDQVGSFAEVLGMCVQLEAEAIQLPQAERAEMLDALGLGDGALVQFVHSAYQLLGRRTFFTTGEKESRAWTFHAGAKAPECAGVIHTDFQRGFIRAEVIHWDELLEVGSWANARKVGKLRTEGKDYEAVDGDVMEFRFNV